MYLVGIRGCCPPQLGCAPDISCVTNSPGMIATVTFGPYGLLTIITGQTETHPRPSRAVLGRLAQGDKGHTVIVIKYKHQNYVKVIV